MAGTLSPSASTSSLVSETTPLSSGSQVSPAFRGLNIAVTGCASTIGRAVCAELSNQGANLALTDASKNAGQALCQDLQTAGHRGSLLLSTIDPRDSAKLTAFLRNASKTLKGLHALVNCATYSPEENLMHRVRPELMSEIMDVNVTSVWTATQAAITQFEQQNDAKLKAPDGGYAIVTIVTGYDDNDHFSSYQMARHALLGLTQSTACEYGNADIRVNLITAGPCGEQDKAMSLINQVFTSVSQVTGKIPMRRLAQPAEIAKVALFLLSGASSYITGANIPVDGGVSAKRA